MECQYWLHVDCQTLFIYVLVALNFMLFMFGQDFFKTEEKVAKNLKARTTDRFDWLD